MKSFIKIAIGSMIFFLPGMLSAATDREAVVASWERSAETKVWDEGSIRSGFGINAHNSIEMIDRVSSESAEIVNSLEQSVAEGCQRATVYAMMLLRYKTIQIKEMKGDELALAGLALDGRSVCQIERLRVLNEGERLSGKEDKSTLDLSVSSLFVSAPGSVRIKPLSKERDETVFFRNRHDHDCAVKIHSDDFDTLKADIFSLYLYIWESNPDRRRETYHTCFPRFLLYTDFLPTTHTFQTDLTEERFPKTVRGYFYPTFLFEGMTFYAQQDQRKTTAYPCLSGENNIETIYMNGDIA